MRYYILGALAVFGSVLGVSLHQEIQTAKSLDWKFYKIKVAGINNEGNLILNLLLIFNHNGNRQVWIKSLMMMFAYKGQYVGSMKLDRRTSVNPGKNNQPVMFTIEVKNKETIGAIISAIKNKNFVIDYSYDMQVYTSTFGTYITIKGKDSQDVKDIIEQYGLDYLTDLLNKLLPK